ncbi:alpha-glucosidase [Salinisphaera sp.]|uniref:alpha-glucosidase n=1 Tax=Salinisphaera sp. TaxID=1914330 RepID=UPI002D7766FD|nr:alpha-glucosidase [Salinisphaera sp.]HET7314777.1 alpha-glucosidase [Salinisphaera sp.]
MAARQTDWWRGAVIYQIYPRSFLDTNGDGVGDLAGAADKLDYIAALGVDAVWLSPFFRSPMADFGYDVSDYRDVDPLFGSLDDFDRLVERAHALGLRVIIDQVLSHTSDAHPWFTESRADRVNPKADWYVWADPEPDGSPPNNWLSVFGGSAWAWDSRRRQYYLHNFLASQPDLNYHHPEVSAQILDDIAFWLERGVDGFRLDTVNFYFHDVQLRNNPASDDPAAYDATNPYAMQRHVYDKTRPENIGFLKRLRTLIDGYDDRALMGEVGEVGADTALAVMAEYTGGGDKLHMAYTFDLLSGDGGAAYIRDTVQALEARIKDGWPAWAMSNHDVMRVATRWGGDDPDREWIKATLAALLCLRGSICIYQGEELGLPEAEVPYERLQDPYGINFWPEFKGRDGARTPMPWRADAAHAGFSGAEPWLPVDPRHMGRAVNVQDADPRSVLAFCRRFLAWRQTQPALRDGTIAFEATGDDVLCFWRETEAQRLLVAINLSGAQARIDTAGWPPLTPVAEAEAARQDDTALILPPFARFFATAGPPPGRAEPARRPVRPIAMS